MLRRDAAEFCVEDSLHAVCVFLSLLELLDVVLIVPVLSVFLFLIPRRRHIVRTKGERCAVNVAMQALLLL